MRFCLFLLGAVFVDSKNPTTNKQLPSINKVTANKISSTPMTVTTFPTQAQSTGNVFNDRSSTLVFTNPGCLVEAFIIRHIWQHLLRVKKNLLQSESATDR